MKWLTQLILLLNLCAQAHALGGTVPSGYPANFMMGYVAEYHADGAGRYVAPGSEFNTLDHYMAPISSSWNATYKYIIGGPRAAGGPNSWWNAWPGSGGMPTNFMNHANSRSWQPMFIYMNLQASLGNYPAGIHGAFQNATFMGQYYSDWADLMTVVNNWLTANPTRIVTIDLEPDAWGYMQQNYSSNPASIPAHVASATNPGGAYPWVPLGAYPNTVQGFARALLHIKDVRLSAANRSRLKLALHISSWAVAPNPATTQSAMNINTHATAVAGFVNACKTTITAGADWDLWFLDPADGDAALYQVNGLDTAGSTHWWDANNVNQPTFNRYRDWVDALTTATSRRAMLWQMPIGNTVYRTMSNTHGHYQDNRIEYFLNPTTGQANVCSWANAGVLGILWGRGSIIPVGGGYTVGTGGPDYWHISWATDYSGGTQDNITNAGASGINATVADDDGGYLRSRMPAYFAAPCVLPGVGTPTPSATRTPAWSPTISPTFTQTPVCPGGYVDGLEDNNATNQWGGGWSAYNPGGGTTMNPASFAPSTNLPGTGSYSARIYGSVTGTNYPSLSSFLNAGGTAASVCTFNALRFQFKGSAGVQYRFQVHSAQQNTPTVEYNDHYFNIAGTGAWATVTIPYASMTHPGWGRAYTLDCAQWVNLSWLPLQPGAYDLNVDEVTFVCLVNTPTPSATATRTPSPTRSATPTASPSRTGTPSATASPTRTATRTASPSHSPSSTGTPTRTPGPSDTASPTRTPSPTASSTRSPTPTLSASPTGTGSRTRTETPTASLTHTIAVGSPTATPTVSRTITITSTSSATPTASLTHTVAVGSPTATPTGSASATMSPTGTLTASSTSVFTVTWTPTASLTHTIAVGSPTATPTVTLTVTRTSTATPTPSATSSVTTTVVVPSLTATPSISPSATVFPASPTATATQTPGVTPPTAVPGEGPNEVLESVLLPNPNPRQARLRLAGPADELRILVYTRAFTLVGSASTAGPHAAGWVSARMPDLGSAPAGTYFYVAQSLRAGKADLGRAGGKLVLIR